jgi:putative ABC transport system substrate-binding protein
MTRVTAALLCAAALGASLAQAQDPPSAVPEVCLLYPGPAAALPPRVDAFRLGLADQGLVVGRNVGLAPHAAGFEAGGLTQAITDCVARNARVITAVSAAVVAAAHAATRTVAIVALDLETDPVAAGIVESFARPGGNVTGIYFDFPEFRAKWLQLLSEASPGITRIGVLWDPNAGATQLAAVRAIVKARGLQMTEQRILDLPSLDARFKALTDGGAQAVLMLSSPFVGSNPKLFADLAATHGLPAITMFPEFAQAGGLMAYGPDLIGLFRPLGDMVGKVVKGAKPAELPVDRPPRMRLIINLVTAKTLGLTLSPSLLARADEVIE